jgi:SIR2-like domain
VAINEVTLLRFYCFMEIPAILKTQLVEGKVILILGAGASLDAVNPAGDKPPSGNALRDMLSDRYLGGEFKTSDLSVVAGYAFSQSSIPEVQEFIKNVFKDFEPSQAHKALPKHRWAGLATTNYDLLLEKAYDQVIDRCQEPFPRVENGDRIIDLQRNPRSVVYLKLHGCITRITNEKCPLILSKDQYIQFRSGRDRLFSQLQDWAYEHTIIFIGHGGQDPDLLEVINDIDLKVNQRPRQYMVIPTQSDIVKTFWADRRITVLDGTFDQFMTALGDSRNALDLIGANITKTEHPIFRRFTRQGAVVSKNLNDFLTNDADYVKGALTSKHLDPKMFYLGHNSDWSAIEQDLDVRRSFADDILEDYFLIDDTRKRKPLEIVLIKGHAGSGKSVAMRRIAWSAANDYDRLCVYSGEEAEFNIGAIQEIIESSGERLYLFVDNAPERHFDISRLIREIGDSGQLLTVILAARYHEWNAVADDLRVGVSKEYEIPSLGRREINDLLAKLERHNALGRLDQKSEEERFAAFETGAGRQLLVALHEVTLGKRFEDILVSEFESIVSPEAKEIYLTICILNRLGIAVRAGLISRIHGVPFSSFVENFYSPLEHVVYDAFDPKLRDNVYRARHPVIAGVVFDRILQNLDRRFTEYKTTLSALNIDYNTDDQAFRRMIRGRTLLDLFSGDVEKCEAIFEVAEDLVGDDPHLMQQRALFEMHRQNGDLDKATRLLNEAILIKPYYKPFLHSKSELLLKRSDRATTELQQNKFLTEAAQIARASQDRRDGSGHGIHTLAKVDIKRLENELMKGGGEQHASRVQSLISAVEKQITLGLLHRPGDSYLLTERAKLARLVNNQPKVIQSLELAFAGNPNLSYIALQLADCYNENNDSEKSIKILEKALAANNTDYRLNYRFGLLLDELGRPPTEIAYYMRNSFVRGDNNFDAQLRYCKALYLNGDYSLLREELGHFRNLERLPYVESKDAYLSGMRHDGRVNGVRSSHLFVTDSKSSISLLIPRNAVNPKDWDKIMIGSQLQYEIGFTFNGLLGLKCDPDLL